MAHKLVHQLRQLDVDCRPAAHFWIWHLHSSIAP